MTKLYTVTIERTAFQEIDIEEIEAETPDQAREFAEAEYRKYARRPCSVWDVREMDSDYTVGKVRLTEPAGDDD